MTTHLMLSHDDLRKIILGNTARILIRQKIGEYNTRLKKLRVLHDSLAAATKRLLKSSTVADAEAIEIEGESIIREYEAMIPRYEQHLAEFESREMLAMLQICGVSSETLSDAFRRANRFRSVEDVRQ